MTYKHGSNLNAFAFPDQGPITGLKSIIEQQSKLLVEIFNLEKSLFFMRIVPDTKWL